MDVEEAYNNFEDKTDKEHNQKEKEYINYSKSIATKIESLLINVLNADKLDGGTPFFSYYSGKLRDVSSANYVKSISRYFDTYRDNPYINKKISIAYKRDFERDFYWIKIEYKKVSITINPDYTFDLYKYYNEEDYHEN